MYINSIDNLFDGLINNFNKFIIDEKLIDKLISDENFVKYQKMIQ